MANCGSCGAELRAGVSFCTQCGASVTVAMPKPVPPLPLPLPLPPPPPPTITVRSTVVRRPNARHRGIVRLGVLGALALLIMLVVVVWPDNGSTPDVPSDRTATGDPDAGAGGASAPAPSDPGSAEQALRAEVAADRSTAEDYVGRWVPQLSSKRVGLVANGITYGYPEIYADFKFLKRLHPDALLVWSGDFTSFQAGDFWVTLVAIGFATGEDANAWCDNQRIDPGNCYAKRLSHTSGYDENTLHRG
jgi:hypothetical protein